MSAHKNKNNQGANTRQAFWSLWKQAKDIAREGSGGGQRRKGEGTVGVTATAKSPSFSLPARRGWLVSRSDDDQHQAPSFRLFLHDQTRRGSVTPSRPAGGNLDPGAQIFTANQTASPALATRGSSFRPCLEECVQLTGPKQPVLLSDAASRLSV